MAASRASPASSATSPPPPDNRMLGGNGCYGARFHPTFVGGEGQNRRHGLRAPPGPGRVPRRAGRLHRAGDQAARAGERQHPVLRPSPRGRTDRLGAGRSAEPRVGGAPPRGPAPSRRRRALSLPVPQGIRRQGGDQPRHGSHPRASRPQGPRLALRSPERARHRRQQRRPAPHARLRHRRAEEGVGGRPCPRPAGLRLRHHRARSRL